jgi:hypothetical protein
MQPAERPEFDAQVRTMFAGLGISAHDNPERLTERVEAWWIGLGKMSLPMFVRCMEHLLAAPAWPEYLPKRRGDMTPGDMWKIAKELRTGPGGAPVPGERNTIRDYWRAAIVHDTARALGHTAATLEPVLIAHKDSLGASMRTLLDEIEGQDRRDGRTVGQHRYVQRKCEQIARMFPRLATERAPRLPEAEREEEGIFA